MAAKYGVNVTISAEAARPIAVESVTPIGIVGFEEILEEGIHFFTNVTKAKNAIEEALLDYNKDKEEDKKKRSGSVLQSLKGIYDQAVETPIILSVFAKDEDAGANTTACKKAVEDLRSAEVKTGYRPNLIIALGFSDQEAIRGAMEAVATRLKATAIIDLNVESQAAALLKMKEFGSKRLLACDPFVKVWSDTENKYVFEPQSARVAGMIAYTDGESEYGFSDSYSNRIMHGISGTKREVDFVFGETCEADELRAAHISTIIRTQGWRSWGGETSDQDTIWQDLARVRIFDRLSEACQKGVFFAIDKKADQLYYAKRSVEELLRALVGAKVLLGFEVTWSEKNTDANITAGKFYLDVRMQNNPIVKQLTLDFIYADKWGGELMKTLK